MCIPRTLVRHTLINVENYVKQGIWEFQSKSSMYMSSTRQPLLQGGNAPLHEAVEKGHLLAVRQLLEMGADVNLPAKVRSEHFHSF